MLNLQEENKELKNEICELKKQLEKNKKIKKNKEIKIFNPIDNDFINLYSKKGIETLNNYVLYLKNNK